MTCGADRVVIISGKECVVVDVAWGRTFEVELCASVEIEFECDPLLA